MKEQPEIGYLQADKLMTFAEKIWTPAQLSGALAPKPFHYLDIFSRQLNGVIDLCTRLLHFESLRSC